MVAHNITSYAIHHVLFLCITLQDSLLYQFRNHVHVCIIDVMTTSTHKFGRESAFSSGDTLPLEFCSKLVQSGYY